MSLVFHMASQHNQLVPRPSLTASLWLNYLHCCWLPQGAFQFTQVSALVSSELTLGITHSHDHHILLIIRRSLESVIHGRG